MNGLFEQLIDCPYCGESIVVLVDESVPEQSYVEDCQVCCRPIVVNTSENPDGELELRVRGENE